jgi:LysM repeat protein
MATEGCYITAIANILTASGSDTTPLDVLNALIANGGINAQGLVIHANVTEAFPTFVYGGTGYAIIGGEWTTTHGKFAHFIAQTPTEVIDSYTGTVGYPSGFNQTSVQPIGIVEPTPIVVDPAPPVDPAPAAPAPEVASVPVPFPYIVKPGDTLGQIISEHYGYDSWAQISARLPEITSLNGIDNPNLIQVGQVIKLP